MRPFCISSWPEPHRGTCSRWTLDWSQRHILTRIWNRTHGSCLFYRFFYSFTVSRAIFQHTRRERKQWTGWTAWPAQLRSLVCKLGHRCTSLLVRRLQWFMRTVRLRWRSSGWTCTPICFWAVTRGLRGSSMNRILLWRKGCAGCKSRLYKDWMY